MLCLASYAVAVLAVLALIIAQPVTTAIVVGLMLVYAGAINFAGIFYRPKENGQLPEHVIRLPIPPLIPALGLAVTVFVAVTDRLACQDHCGSRHRDCRSDLRGLRPRRPQPGGRITGGLWQADQRACG